MSFLDYVRGKLEYGRTKTTIIPKYPTYPTIPDIPPGDIPDIPPRIPENQPDCLEPTRLFTPHSFDKDWVEPNDDESCLNKCGDDFIEIPDGEVQAEIV
jgi:hypothetical protein